MQPIEVLIRAKQAEESKLGALPSIALSFIPRGTAGPADMQLASLQVDHQLRILRSPLIALAREQMARNAEKGAEVSREALEQMAIEQVQTPEANLLADDQPSSPDLWLDGHGSEIRLERSPEETRVQVTCDRSIEDVGQFVAALIFTIQNGRCPHTLGGRFV